MVRSHRFGLVSALSLNPGSISQPQKSRNGQRHNEMSIFRNTALVLVRRMDWGKNWR